MPLQALMPACGVMQAHDVQHWAKGDSGSCSGADCLRKLEKDSLAWAVAATVTADKATVMLDL
jgi:hypothetical protein